MKISVIKIKESKGQQSKCEALNKIFAYFQDKNAIKKVEIKASMVS